ncbi:MAG: FRG domain-containing protein [Acidobacteriales bacterium]|nr:FRG domain-containing protein [Terriglobales bacterium]
MPGKPRHRHSVVIREATSLSEYLKLHSDTSKGWGDTKIWCRGQSNTTWKLLPWEYRPPFVLDSDEIRSEFQLKSWPLLKNLPGSEWEWYFLMQHYGLPTRLLDWSVGSLLGLYFALRNNTGETAAAVWLLDPWALNEKTIKSAELLLTTDDAARPFLPPIFAKRAKLPQKPIAIVPPYNSPRITVQRGAFTVHGSERMGLESFIPERLMKIEIPANQCVRMKRDLRLAGINEFTVFPDLDGLCREIRAELNC